MEVERLPALWGRIRAEELAELTGAHITSARRWKRLQILPRWLQLLVAVVAEGQLREVSRAWAGWCIQHGELVSPEGERFTPGMVRAASWHRQHARHLARRLATQEPQRQAAQDQQPRDQQRRA